MPSLIGSLYERATIDRPWLAWLIVILLSGLSAWWAQGFELDASSDALVLENDQDLRFYRALRARYGSDEFLVVTYSPQSDMMSDPVIADLKALRTELAALPRVKGVISLLDAPLIDSPRTNLSELQQQVRTLETPDTDRELARRELRDSPLYRDLLMSPDGRTTALQINLIPDPRQHELQTRRDALWAKRAEQPLGADEEAELNGISAEIAQRNIDLQAQLKADIATVRTVLDRHRAQAEIHLGGVPMIASDMVDYVANDIEVFGVGVTLFLVALLAVFFKRLRWVLAPLAICVVTSLAMLGFLGWAEWRVTVVSSNFISLLLITALAVTVHLIVRHQERHAENPQATQRELLTDAVRNKFVPAIYTTLTTQVAFASLIVSDIRPVMDFGWMMVVGVGLAFLFSFLMFPMLLTQLQPGTPIFRRHDSTAAVTRALAGLIQRHGNAILLVYALVIAAGIWGITRLSVENRFIDYFKPSTEIYQGMVLIDRELGGTTPLDVVIDPNKGFLEWQKEEAEAAAADAAAGVNMPTFEDNEAGLTGSSYWFNVFQLEQVEEIHDYLDALPETGKVLSVATAMKMLRMLNNDQPLDNFTLAVMYKRLPPDIKSALFTPYMSEDGNQMRFSIRVIDSDKNLQRNELLKKIRTDLADRFKLEPEQIHLSGMLVLYNNVLQSLFRSQILTLSVVFVAISLMLLILFRSLRLALIGVTPTVVAACLILGLIGIIGIPLDIMTITIAAITIGIGVDNSIHYIHRFQEELPKDRDYWAAVKRCHGSVGRAIYYTSITVTLGFSILALSNFIPTIYFGLLTGVAMVVALIANLTLLPLLLVRFRPLRA